MLNVANVIEDARIAGPQRRMVIVARALRSRVVTTLVIPIRDSEQLRILCQQEQVPFRTVATIRGSKHPLGILNFLLRFPIDIVRAHNIFRDENFDLVHVSGGAWQFKSVIAAWLAGRPVVWHLNDTAMPRLIRWTFRIVAPLAHGLIFASIRTSDYYKPLVPARPSAIVPSVVDTDHYDPTQTPDADSIILSILGDRPVVGTVASVNPNKDLHTFLNSFARVCAVVPSACALIVGPVYASQRAYRQSLEKHAETLGIGERIIWSGAQTDVRPLLKRMDVYLCSSRHESSPMAVWEAMAMARAVVSSNVGDVGLHVIDGETGFVTAIGDDAAMAARLLELLQDASKRRLIGARARAMAKKHFAPGIVAAKTEALYRQLISE